MSEISKNSIVIEATAQDVAALIFDPANYPSWSSSILSSKVLESDSQGRATKVDMNIKAGPVKDHVILDYDLSEAPDALHFSLDEADMLTEMSGTYSISDNEDGSVKVSYQLTVGLSMPVPDMMRTKAERETIDKVLSELKSKLEN